MLTTLRIKNLALVTDLTLELSPGYNAITGETGAGKSILIGALNLVLGERADRTLIRSGSENCSVEARFDVSKLEKTLGPFLEGNGIEACEDNHLLLKRTFSAAGTNRQFINGTPTTLQTLATVGEWLVDIHGPHEHQSLIHPAKQLAIMDAFGGLHLLRGQFADSVRRRELLLEEKAALIVDEKTYAQQIDLLRFQASEISSAMLRADEEDQISQEHRRASNAARLLQLARASLSLVSEEEGSLLANSAVLGRTLQELKAVDSASARLFELHGEASGALHDLQKELSDYLDRLEMDPERLQQLEERLNLIHSLKRKYGKTLAEVMEFGEQAKQKLQNLEQRDVELSRINSEITRVESQLNRAGQELSAQRKKMIPKLCKAVIHQLSDLGFKQSHFEIAMTTSNDFHQSKSQVSLSGLDVAEFLFAPNIGEPPRPLRAIASSGEMARVMLALKTVLAAEDEVPVLIFDEIDANVGGETACVVGEKMRQIAKEHQVLCITHLAQVAAPALAHYVVTKQIKNERTVSEVTLLNRQQRIDEMARMLGGQSDASRQLAESLLK